MRLQPLRIRRITWPMCSGKFFPHIWNPWPRFAYSLYNFFGATIKINEVIWQNSVWPCVKEPRSSLRVHKITPARNVAVNLLPSSFHDFPLTGSNFGNLIAFTTSNWKAKMLAYFHCASAGASAAQALVGCRYISSSQASQTVSHALTGHVSKYPTSYSCLLNLPLLYVVHTLHTPTHSLPVSLGMHIGPTHGLRAGV